MRKLILSALLLAAAVLPAAAQTRTGDSPAREREHFRYRSYRTALPSERWSVRLGAGMYSESNTQFFMFGSRGEKLGGGLSAYYGGYPGNTYSSGCYSVGAEYHIARWFAVSADISIEALWRDVLENGTGRKTGTSKGVALAFVPQAKFIYLHRPLVRIYSGIGFGAVQCFGFETMEHRYVDENGSHVDPGQTLRFTGQFTLIGVEVGRKLFGFLECGSGSIFTGIRAGAGYKF